MKDEIRYRHEYKYVITDAQAAYLKTKLDVLMKRDVHTNQDGKYVIRSLYFDDYYNRCFFENENGVDPREKYRFRMYNGSTDRITLECKRKERGKTLKTVSVISEEFARRIVNRTTNMAEGDSLVHRFENEIRTRELHPSVIVEYERVPYVCKEGNVRVTFDSNLSSSLQVDQFLDGDYSKRLIMPTGFQLLEVKFDEFLPDYIYHALGIENMRQEAYSKFYLCRKIHL